MPITTFETALDTVDEIDLMTTGRVSGQPTSRPVWYVRQDQRLFLLPVTGSRSQWYKNLLKTPTIRLTAGESELAANAVPLTEPDVVRQVVELFRAKYGAGDVAQYYPNPNVAVQINLGQ
jgi:deazaflavin-dependent oxidoreductase (nitroreductase family)